MVHIMNETNIDRVPHGVLIKIRALYDTLKSAERKLVDYLLETPPRWKIQRSWKWRGGRGAAKPRS